MSVVLDTKTIAIVQGMTGTEGRRATVEMIDSGVAVVAGVTPGKGGTESCGRPVFDTVAAAVAFEPTINTSVLYVPAVSVKAAALEALDAGIATIIIVAENVPVRDAAEIFERAQQCRARVLGPSSIGVLNTKLGKLGSIAKPQESTMYSAGRVGIVSKSGGMCAETALALTQAGLGQSTVVGIGGDVIACSNFVDILQLFEQDDDTDAVVLFGEIGGFYEHQVADMVLAKKFTKPLVAFISGQFAEAIGRDVALGHAGAIIQGAETTAQAKKKALRAAGVLVADYHHQIPQLVKKALNI